MAGVQDQIDTAIQNTNADLANNQLSADPTKTFDLASYLENEMNGARVTSVNSDGTAKIVYPDQNGEMKSGNFDTHRMLKDQGIDPLKIKVQYNTPGQALDDNPIGFATGLKMALSDPKQQMAQLEKQYGKGNVKINPDGPLQNAQEPGALEKLKGVAAGVGGGEAGQAAGRALTKATKVSKFGGPIGAILGSAGAAYMATKGEAPFLVNDNGAWKKANPGFLANLAAESPETLAMVAAGAHGGVTGAALGGAIGSVVPGPGTAAGAVIGGIIGGGVEAALAASAASSVKEKGLEMLGLKSEKDAKEAADFFGKHLANNLLWGSLAHYGGTAIRTGAPMAANAANRAGKFFGDKETVAQAAANMLDNPKLVQDTRTIVRSPEDAKAVADAIKVEADWKQNTQANEVMPGPSPATQKINGMVNVALKAIKTKASEQYEAGMNSLQNLVDQNGRAVSGDDPILNLSKSTNEFKKTLGKLGVLAPQSMVRKDPHGNEVSVTGKFGRIIEEDLIDPTAATAECRTIQQIFDKKSLATLNDIMRTVNMHVTDDGLNGMSFNSAKKFLGAIDEVLESSGYYQGGEMAISSNTRRALMQLRSNINGQISESLSGKTVSGSGRDAGQAYKETSAKYSQFREIYDDFAMPNKFGGGDLKVSKTVDKMLGPEGYELEDKFGKLFQSVGMNAEPWFRNIQQQRAAKNMSESYGKKTGIKGALNYIGRGGPRETALALSQSMQDGYLARVNASGPTKMQAAGRAQALDALNKMSPEQQSELMNNPELLKAFMSSIDGAGAAYQATQQQIQQQIQKAQGGGGQQ